MALMVIKKINGRLRFLYRKNQILIAVSEKNLKQCYNQYICSNAFEFFNENRLLY